MKMANPTFEINKQALAVMHMVADYDLPPVPENQAPLWEVKTHPWYNGRERGVLFSFGKLTGPVLRIAVFEHRNSDSLCALKWKDDSFGLNPPTIESHASKAYPQDNKWDDIAKTVGWGNIGEMVSWIVNEVSQFIFDSSPTTP